LGSSWIRISLGDTRPRAAPRTTSLEKPFGCAGPPPGFHTLNVPRTSSARLMAAVHWPVEVTGSVVGTPSMNCAEKAKISWMSSARTAPEKSASTPSSPACA
jgi:hypothetical protein